VGVRILLPVLCLAVIVGRCGVTFRDLGFPARPVGDLKPLAFVGLALLWSLACLSFFLFDVAVLYALDASPGEEEDPMSSVGAPPLAAIIYYLLTAPLLEEVFYRGVLGAALLSGRASSRVLFVAVSAALFGAAHATVGGIPAFVSTAYFGALVAVLYLIVPNIWLVVIAHFVTEAVALFSSYLQFGSI
jgi:membrane protease YdiL (CAAX protease family)